MKNCAKIDCRIWGKKKYWILLPLCLWWDLQTQVDKNGFLCQNKKKWYIFCVCFFALDYFVNFTCVCESIKIQFCIFKNWIVIIVWFHGTFRDKIKDFFKNSKKNVPCKPLDVDIIFQILMAEKFFWAMSPHRRVLSGLWHPDRIHSIILQIRLKN